MEGDKQQRDYQSLAENVINDVNYRENLDIEIFIDIEHCLKQLCEENVLFTSLKEFYNVLVFLRNACIRCPTNQTAICNTDILVHYSTIMSVCLHPELQSKFENEDLLRKTKCVALQFLGNLIVQNKDSKEKVWKFGFPSLFFKFMSNLDDKGKDLFCMVIYNCLKDRELLYSNDDEYWLLISILEYCQQFQQAEWGLLVLELIISSNDFQRFFQKLIDYPKLRACLLEMLEANLESDHIDIPECNLCYLSELFMTKCTCILQLATDVNEQLIEESCLLVQTLSMLCTATSYTQKYQSIRSNEKLFKSAIGILSQISESEFALYFSSPSDPNISNSELHPAYGFKRNLIKIIGNMMYMNKKLQDLIRDNDGIKHILNSCVVDNKNPFIMQCSIFAIHNLCEGNVENQKYIKQLEQQGVVTNNFTTECNVRTDVKNGKIVVSNT